MNIIMVSEKMDSVPTDSLAEDSAEIRKFNFKICFPSYKISFPGSKTIRSLSGDPVEA
jgi:hypothetical protein